MYAKAFTLVIFMVVSAWADFRHELSTNGVAHISQHLDSIFLK